jgi:hypothetical protein
MEWCDLPPGPAIRQAFVDAALAVLRSGGGLGSGAGLGTKLQHFAANHGGWAAMPVTGLTIHDIVISP